MKIIGHRGFSAGAGENTLTNLKKARDFGIDGVEIDVRFASDTDKLVLSHNRSSESEALLFRDALAFLESTDLDIMIDIKSRWHTLFEQAQDIIANFDLTDRLSIHGFKRFARHFTWTDTGDKMQGLIILNPWLLDYYVDRFDPDLVLFCFNDYRWTWKLFWWYWTPETLTQTIKKYPDIKFVIGIDNYKNDVDKMQQVEGLHALITDRPEMWL